MTENGFPENALDLYGIDPIYFFSLPQEIKIDVLN